MINFIEVEPRNFNYALRHFTSNLDMTNLIGVLETCDKVISNSDKQTAFLVVLTQ